jgi:enolase
MKIDTINLNLIPDSRNQDTLQVEMKSGDLAAIASVPSGKSTGSSEAHVLEPHQALEKFAQIEGQIRSLDFSTVEQFDSYLINLDGTADKSNLGGNLLLALSIGFTKLLAASRKLEVFQLISEITGVKPNILPLGFFNLIEGGLHAKDSLPLQEYLYVPQYHSPSQNLNTAVIFVKVLGDNIQKHFGELKYGDEGGYTVPSDDPLKGLELLQETWQMTGQDKAKFSLDVAASSLVKDGSYHLGEKSTNGPELLDFYRQVVLNFDILSIEDPFDEDDWDGFEKITEELGDRIWIVGDDLTTTNPERVKMAQDKKAANAMIVKPNQIGTVTETIKAAQLAKSYGWKIIVSHRSGETMDTFIADLAVGLSADALKAGCPLQKERLVKYQRLVEIEFKLKKAEAANG